MANAFKKISKKLNIPVEKISFNYKEHELNEKYNDLTVKEFFNFPKNTARPIIYVKDKLVTSINANNNINTDFTPFYKRNYDNKIKITNYPSLTVTFISVKDG